MKDNRIISILYAFMAAVFYALNMPLSKYLLNEIPPTMMAAFLYLGAGIGIGAVYLLSGQQNRDNKLTKVDFPYTAGMIVLDIAAPIFLMLGLTTASAANASLLNNFEIVATSLIALFLFKEKMSLRLWGGILMITISSMLLTVEGASSIALSRGSLLVLAATCCWGLENNCTRRISGKNTYQIVMIKGIFSGMGSLIIALVKGEYLTDIISLSKVLLLGFVAYGLSIFYYILAQKTLGAAKTSAYYAVAPFVGSALSFLLLKESLSRNYFAALLVMLAGSALVVADTLVVRHKHVHTHIITHTHAESGSTHTHKFTHEHSHSHYMTENIHNHKHNKGELYHIH